MPEFIREFWHAIAATVSAIIWLVRLEGKAVANQTAILQLKETRKEDLERAKEERKEVLGRLDDIANDIKALIKDRTK